MSDLADHLSIALRIFGELDRERFRAATLTDALARAGIGWSALDREARLIDGGDNGSPEPGTAGEAIASNTSGAKRALASLARDMSNALHGTPRPIRIDGEIPLDVLALPPSAQLLSASVMPARPSGGSM